MKRAIVLTPAGGLASAEIDLCAVASVVRGQRVLVTAGLDFGPYGLVVAGDTGCVTYVNHECGEVQITIDRFIRAMCPWENTFSLMPFESDEMLDKLQARWVAVVCAGDRLAAC